MASGIDIVMLVCLATVACVGTTLNCLTMYILVRNKILRKQLASVRWLMFGQALSEALVCGVGAPVIFANMLIGPAPPITTVPLLCYLHELIGFGAGYVAAWYQTIIALTRLAAVIAPNWYREHEQNRFTSVALFLFPWCIGYVTYAVGALTHAYAMYPTVDTGICTSHPYDDSAYAQSRFASYLLADTFLHSWSSTLLGLLCYIVLYTKKWWTMWRKKPQVKSIQVSPAWPPHTGNHLSTTTHQRTPNLMRVSVVSTISKALVDSQHHRSKTEKERDQKIKLLAIAYVVNICLVFPNNGIVFGFNYYSDLAKNFPVAARLLDIMSFSALTVNPLLYILVSKDFRQAFRDLLHCKTSN